MKLKRPAAERPAAKRKPALKPAGALTNRERIWAQIRAYRQTCGEDRDFTVPALAGDTGLPREMVRDYVIALTRAGYLSICRRPHDARPAYFLATDTGVEAPRPKPDGSAATMGEGRAAAWRAMQALREFSLPDLVATSKASAANLKDWIAALLKAAYLVLIRAGRPGQPARYRLVKATGPKPPQRRRDGSIFDPNLSPASLSRDGTPPANPSHRGPLSAPQPLPTAGEVAPPKPAGRRPGG